MRINLVTPFAEKDKVKSLGAKWDAARKQWYVVDVPDLTPFMRWIPDMQAAMEAAASVSGLAPAAKPASGRAEGGGRPVMTRSGIVKETCSCTVLPWEDCPHTQP